METAERVHISLRCHIVSKDTVAHSQLPGFIQAIARMTSNNEAFRLNLRGDARRRREVVHMADWPAPDPQAWQPPAPVTSQSLTSQPEQPQPESAEWTPPTWEELVRDHGARVYRLAYRLTGNPHDAEDLTQPGTFEGWLHRITTNLFLDGARRRQKIRFDGLGEGSDERLPSAWPNPSEQLADADLDHDVAAALSALPPEFRAAVVLCDVEGLSYEEISEVLDIKIGTVRSRIHRGRAQLRSALAHRRPTGERLRYLGVEVESGEIPDRVASKSGASSKLGSLEPARST